MVVGEAARGLCRDFPRVRARFASGRSRAERAGRGETRAMAAEGLQRDPEAERLRDDNPRNNLAPSFARLVAGKTKFYIRERLRDALPPQKIGESAVRTRGPGPVGPIVGAAIGCLEAADGAACRLPDQREADIARRRRAASQPATLSRDAGGITARS